MPDPLPQRLDFRILGATLNFQMKQYQRTADILLPVYHFQRENLSADALYLLAESLYEMGELSTSGELFNRLAETEKYRRTARHRIVQLSNRQGKEQTSALSLNSLVEEGESDPWYRFAVQDSRFRKLISNL
jgi:hypothetical protein